MPYTQHSGITKHDLDEELADAQDRMTDLHNKGRHDTQEGTALQQKITDLNRLVELRGLIMEKNAPDTHPTTQKVQSESDRLSHPHSEHSNITRDDLDEDVPKT